MRAGLSDRGADGLSLVTAEVVHHDHVARKKCRDEDPLGIRLKGLAVDRAVEGEGRVDPVVAQRGDERHRPPVAVRRTSDQALASRRPAPERGHVGPGPGFIDEDRAARVDPPLVPLPPGTAAAHVGAVPFLGEPRLFLNE